jgi:hypothetical protein
MEVPHRGEAAAYKSYVSHRSYPSQTQRLVQRQQPPICPIYLTSSTI